MRTAGLMPPCVATLPTPEISESRCASNVSARSLNARSDTVSEVSASVTIGVSAGFTFE